MALKGVETDMTTSLARVNGRLSQNDARPATWAPFSDLLGYDPFQALRTNYGYDYDVTRTESGYEVDVPVPGYKSEQIDITFKDGILTVVGKSERRSFSRSFTVPEDVDQDNILAKVADGMLRLTLDRRPEAQPRRIMVD